MENYPQKEESKVSKGLGIAGLVIGIIALVVAFIPCFGCLAIYPGILAIVLTIIGFILDKKTEPTTRKILIAAIIISIIGTAVAGVWCYMIRSGKMEQIIKDKVEKTIEEHEDEINEALKEAAKDIEETSEEFEEKASELEEEAEKLETTDSTETDTVK